VTTTEEIIMFSFSQQQIAQFQAFGFVVMRGLLNEAETATLTREVTATLTDAFGGIGTDTDPAGAGGIRGHYLPLSVDRTPLSQSLMADDPRLFQCSAALLGHPTVPTAPIATCFTSNAGWHTDQGPRVGGVKFLAHLQRRTAGTGALRVVPGSHDPAFAERVRGFWSRDPALVVDTVDFDHQGYDRQRWPTWREWEAATRSVPSRQVAVERLRLLGVLGEGDPR